MINKDEWRKLVTRPYPPLLLSTVVAAGDDKGNEGLLDVPYGQDYQIYCNFTVYYQKEEMDDMAKRVYKSWQDSIVFSSSKVEIEKREKAILEAASGKDEFAFLQAMLRYTPMLHLVYVPQEIILEQITAELEKKVSKEETEALLNILNIPERDNYYKQVEYDLVMSDDLDAHVKKYEWINSRYFSDNPYTVAEAKEALSVISEDRETYKKNYEHEKTKVRQAVEKSTGILGDKSYLVDVMQYIVFYRTQRTDVINRCLYTFLPRLKEMAKEQNLTLKQVLHATYREILEKSIPSADELNKRVKDYGLFLNKGEWRILVGDELKELQDDLKEDFSGVIDVKGEVCCKGVVRGEAKIIKGVEDSHKINDGDILIASMTTPNMIPMMKKAAAFVTDEGGITCHAAIVSREMRKPCVIGTKVATQFFKDGDMIEVDAENGIVKKL